MTNALPVLRSFIAGSYADPVDAKTAPIVDPCTGEAYAHALAPAYSMWVHGDRDTVRALVAHPAPHLASPNTS